MNRFERVARLVTALLVAWALPVALANAQQPDDNSAQGTTEPAIEPSDNAAGQDSGPSTATSNDSPFDYKASEKISEDLSVSFPVDI